MVCLMRQYRPPENGTRPHQPYVLAIELSLKWSITGSTPESSNTSRSCPPQYMPRFQPSIYLSLKVVSGETRSD